MKIISLSSSIAGPACAIATSIKKYFYNNNYKTNIFDYLEISLFSILQILRMKNSDIEYLSENNYIEKNIDNNYSVTFKNFDKIISHHDLKDNYNIDDYNNFIEKYKRRYWRLIDDIYTENIIFFIRYGIEKKNEICEFIETIESINSNLKFYFIQVFNDKNIILDETTICKNNHIQINLYNKIDCENTCITLTPESNNETINIYNNNNNYFNTINLEWIKIYNIIDKLNNKFNNEYKLEFFY